MNKPLFLLLSIFFVSSCIDKDNSQFGDVELPPPMEVSWSPMNEGMKVSSDMTARSINANFDDQQAAETKIITSANLTIEVASIEKFNEALKAALATYEATITSENRNDYDRRMESSFTIRVPSSNFQSLFNALKPFGEKIENQSINSQDVTEQFIDLESRLKNRKALEERYREILKQAKNINDILNIERQLNQVRSEIESQEGRLKYLNDQVDMSTIQLTAYEIKPFTYEPEESDGFGQKLLKALGDGWRGLIGGIVWLISLWPIALVIVLFGIIIKRRRKD
jgi:hypothetical protein